MLTKTPFSSGSNSINFRSFPCVHRIIYLESNDNKFTILADNGKEILTIEPLNSGTILPDLSRINLSRK